MSTPYIGELKLVPYTFAPRGWAFANGSLMAIAQNSALFSLVGTNYGGNGVTTFGLPDLRGRVPIGATNGQAPGLSTYTLGQLGGSQNVTLVSTQMPTHSHLVGVSSEDAAAKTANGNVMATAASPIYATGPIDGTMSPSTVQLAGGNQPHENMQPYLVLNWIIALQGVYPSRN